MYRKYKYEIEWENKKGFEKNCNLDCPIEETCSFAGGLCNVEFYREIKTELDAITYAIDWMHTKGIDSNNLMYCRVEEVFDSEMRTNVLLWIGE